MLIVKHDSSTVESLQSWWLPGNRVAAKTLDCTPWSPEEKL